MKKYFSFVDQLCIQAELLLHLSSRTYAPGARPNPAAHVPDASLSENERQHVVRLMRINHSGEVCAQALYLGQALVARHSHTREALNQAALEEGDHLLWCQTRLQELQGRTSVLNPVWYVGSLVIGMVAASFGDAVSLGFIEETEKQVEKHLAGHLAQLPAHDTPTRIILTQMLEDEAAHGHHARVSGAQPLPAWVQRGMHVVSQIMVESAKRI